MKQSPFYRSALLAVGLAVSGAAGAGSTDAQTANRSSRWSASPAKMSSGCPTPQALVDKMLDMAKVHAAGSRHGSRIGRRAHGHHAPPSAGARAWASNTTPTWWSLSKRNAAAAGVTDQGHVREGRPLRDRPVEGDGHHPVPAAAHQHEAAARRSSTIKPGTRIVSNTFTMEDWQPDERATVVQLSTSWCDGVVLDRAGQGRRRLADAPGHAHAQPAVSGRHR